MIYMKKQLDETHRHHHHDQKDKNFNNNKRQVRKRKKSFIERVLYWIITLDFDSNNNSSSSSSTAQETQETQKSGDVSIRSERNYHYLSKITNYVFCFGGRFRMIRKTNEKYFYIAVYLSLISIIITTIIMFHFLTQKENTNINNDYDYNTVLIYRYRIIFIIFWFGTTSCFIRASNCDPGILPRNMHRIIDDPVDYYSNEYLIPLETVTRTGKKKGKKSAREEEEEVQEETVMKYCTTCQIWRPPRSYHCSTCQICVEYHDHHCIWMNTCVGIKNYTKFINFLIMILITSGILIKTCISILLEIKDFHKNGNDSKLSTIKGLTIYNLIFSICCIPYPLLLLIFHFYLMLSNQTTRDFLKKISSKNGHTSFTGSTKDLFQFNRCSIKNLINRLTLPNTYQPCDPRKRNTIK